MINEKEVRTKIRQYISEELIRDEDELFADNEGIITGGLIDSFALAELAVFVEEAFNVYIPDPDLTVAKMDTLNQIVTRIMQDVK